MKNKRINNKIQMYLKMKIKKNMNKVNRIIGNFF